MICVTLQMASIFHCLHLSKQFACPQQNKRVNFAKAQKALRKEVERAFRVILRGPARFLDQKKICMTMVTYVIVHYMII